MIQTLLSVRWLSFRNSLSRAEPAQRSRTRINLLFSVVLLFGLSAMAFGFLAPFAGLARSEPWVNLLLARLPAAALFISFWMLLVSAISVGIQHFYMNPEFTLLLPSPVRPRHLFGAKFVEATLINAGLFLSISLPLVAAYSMVRGSLSVPSLLLSAAALLAFAVLPTSIGLLACFGLMRVLPAGRAREALGALGIAVFAVFYVAISIAATRSGDADVVRDTAERYLKVVSAPLMHLGPWDWCGRLLTGDANALQSGLFLFAAAAGGLAACLAGACALFAGGWFTAQESSVRLQYGVASGLSWERRLRWIPGSVRAFFLKDIRNLTRDLRQLSLLFIPIAIIVVYLVHVRENMTAAVHPLVLAMGVHPVLAMVSLRIALSSFVVENRAIWLGLVAPIDPMRILFGKLLYAFSLAAPLAAAAAIIYGSVRGLRGYEPAVNLLLALESTAAYCGIGVGFSALFGSFADSTPRGAISPGSRLLTFFVQMAYLILMIFAVVIATWLLHATNVSPAAIWVCVGGVTLGMSTIAGLGPLLIGAARMRRLEI